MNLTYEALLNDPNLYERIRAQAQRERAVAVHQLIVLPIKRFFADHAARMRASPSRSPHVQGRPA